MWKKYDAAARGLIIPIAVGIAALHALVVAMILLINSSRADLSRVMQEAGRYTADATSLLAGSSLLSETASNYVLMPVTESGEVNVFPLMAYAEELGVERRGEQVTARFQAYHVSDAARARLSEAAVSAERMLQNQLHAISLTRAVHPFPDDGPLAAIPAAALSAEEQALSDAEKAAAALLFDINYLKQTNDTRGHLAGDQLIRAAADCISACFGENCFRFGGDEFAAVVRNCTPEGVRGMVTHFEQVEKERGVSVSVGFAYAEELSETTLRKLLDEADRRMYDQKKHAHRAEKTPED